MSSDVCNLRLAGREQVVGPADSPPDRQPCPDPAAALVQLDAALQKAREARPHGALARAHAARLLDDEHKTAFLLAEDSVVKVRGEVAANACAMLAKQQAIMQFALSRSYMPFCKVMLSHFIATLT